MLAKIQFIRRTVPWLLLLMIFAFGGCSDDEHTVIQVVDDNLESGSSSWLFVNVGDAAHEGLYDNTVSSSSSHSLATKSPAMGVDGFSFWRYALTPTNIPVESSLELTVKVKVTDLTGDGAYIALRGDKGSAMGFFETTQGVSPINGTKDFATYTVKLASYPADITIVYIFLIMGANSAGTAHFDDISLVAHH